MEMELASLEVVYPVIENAIIAALPLKKPQEEDADGGLGGSPAIGNFIRPKPAGSNTVISSSAVSEDEGIFMSRSSMASSSEGSSPSSRHSYPSSIASAVGGDSTGRNKVWSSATNNWTFSSLLSDHPTGQRKAFSFPGEERGNTESEAYYQFGPVGAAPIRRLVLVKEADRSDNRNNNNNNELFYDVSPPRTPRGLIDVDARSPCCERELCLLDKIFLDEMSVEEQQRARNVAATHYGHKRRF